MKSKNKITELIKIKVHGVVKKNSLKNSPYSKCKIRAKIGMFVTTAMVLSYSRHFKTKHEFKYLNKCIALTLPLALLFTNSGIFNTNGQH